LSFIFRAVIVLIVFSFVVYVLKALARLSFNVRKTVREVRAMRDEIHQTTSSRAGQASRAERAISAEMIRCAACGAFVAAGEALTLKSAGGAQTFCSQECLHAHARRA
jgi:hypothetical protein